MKKVFPIVILTLMVIGFGMASCNGCSSNKEKATPLLSPYSDDASLIVSEYTDDVVHVPFTVDRMLEIVKVQINDRIIKDMILDTGASYTQITANEANYLYKEGVLTNEDILGSANFGDANGNITANMVVNLRKVVLGGSLSISNVKATVVENLQAPLLLGQTVLEELPQYTIDNEKNIISFKIR